VKILTKLLLVLFTIVMLHCERKKEAKPKINTPPIIDNVTLLPLNPTIESEITARILGSDADGDPITFRINWFVNGAEIGEGLSFSYEEVKKGDKIYAEVSPFDGKTWGEPVKANEITIGDLPPKILSIKIAPESLFVTTPRVAVNALVEDPDGDSVTLIIHWLVQEKVLPETSSVLNLTKFKLKKNDVITAAAFATDCELRSKPFTFELIIANSPPTFTTDTDSLTCRDDSIYYPLPIVDPDEDPITFQILHAPAGIKLDKANGIIYGSPGDTTEFEVVVRVTDPEGAYLDAKFTLTPAE